MMRVRLRPSHGDVTLAMMYDTPHEHGRWPDHVQRVKETIALGRELTAVTGPPAVIADLSCGDATIPRALAGPETVLILGDLAPGYEITGPVEDTILQLDRADLLVCTETIEHLDDPDTVLEMMARKAGALLLSTPLGEFNAGNFQHYWGWDADAVRAMLERAGWTPVLYRDVSCEVAGGTWAYQIWGCL